MKNYIAYILICFITSGYTQSKEIFFETHGKVERSITANPFQKFIGEWTLKDNRWTQNWGGQTETISIPEHHTISTQINTANSLFSIVDGPEPNGHIFWSYNPVTKKINHLSSFGELRAGVGEGSINEKGDLTLKITFEGEPEHTYRRYNYIWVTEDEYHMKSVQYDLNNKPTGLFYEGVFVRLPKVDKQGVRKQIKTVLAVLDNNELPVEAQLEVYTKDVVHMAPGNKFNIGKKALGNFLNAERMKGVSDMKHEILELEHYGRMVIVRGQVKGIYHPKGNRPSIAFQTKNLFVFQSEDGRFKIKKVIYNSAPLK